MKDSDSTASPRRRVLAYDALRAFAILSVVAIHSFMPVRGVLPGRSTALVVDELLHYAVPLFVFISGVLVWGRYAGRGPESFSRFLRGRFAAVGLPYLGWSVAFLGIAFAQASDPLALLERAPGLLLSGHLWYHLYFVPMLLGFYVLTPVAAPLVRRWPEATVALVYLLRILAWPAASAWLRSAVPDLAWSYATHIATHLPHMVLGAWFAVRLSAPTPGVRRLWPIPFAAGTAILLARALGAFDTVPYPSRGAIYPVGMAATVIGLVLCAFWLDPLLQRFERTVTRGAAFSFGVYFVHPIFLLALWELAERTVGEAVWLSWWAIPASWVLVSAASYGTTWALSVPPGTRWLVGTAVSRRPDTTVSLEGPPASG